MLITAPPITMPMMAKCVQRRSVSSSWRKLLTTCRNDSLIRTQTPPAPRPDNPLQSRHPMPALPPDVLAPARDYNRSAVTTLLESYAPLVHRLAASLCGTAAAGD